MKSVRVSSKDRIAIPSAAPGAQQTSPSKDPGWKKLEGAAAGTDLIKGFVAHKRRDRKRETRP